MKSIARSLLVAIAVALPGTAMAADVIEYTHLTCEPVEPNLTPYQIECPVVNGRVLYEVCACDPPTVVPPPPQQASAY